MFSSFFNTLSKTQLLVFFILTLLLLYFALPQIQRWFYIATSEDYSSWDPDNVNNLREDIKKKIKELESLKAEEEKLVEYRNSIKSSTMVLVRKLNDEPTAVSLLAIQPYNIFNNLDAIYTGQYATQPYYNNYGGYGPNGNLPTEQGIHNSVRNDINSAYTSYIQAYMEILAKLGYMAATYPEFYTRRITEFDITRPVYGLDSASGTMQPIAAPKVDTGQANAFYEKGLQGMLYTLNNVDTTIALRMEKIAGIMAVSSTRAKELQDKFNKKNFNINQYAVVIGIPFFIIAALLMYYFGLKSNQGTGEPGFIGMDPKDKLAFALNTITVLLLILTLLILGLAKIIAENALAALLGTIGGYVLNNAKSKDALAKNMNIDHPEVVIGNTEALQPAQGMGPSGKPAAPTGSQDRPPVTATYNLPGCTADDDAPPPPPQIN